MKFVILACTLLLFGYGCGVKSSKELAGVYSVKYSHGSERLVLNEDSTFIQVYTQVEDGRSITNSGTWEYKKEDREILLRDSFLFDEWGARAKQPLKKTVWRIRIVKRFDKISLIIGEEGVTEYDKTQ